MIPVPAIIPPALAVISGLTLAAAGFVADSPWVQFGLAGAVVGVVMWQSWQRETRMAERIDILEDRQDSAMATTNERNIIALEQVASAIEANNRLVQRLLDTHPDPEEELTR